MLDGLAEVKRCITITKKMCQNTGLEKCKNFSLVDGLNLALRQVNFVEQMKGVKKNGLDSGKGK